jgi:hypothetical protein
VAEYWWDPVTGVGQVSVSVIVVPEVVNVLVYDSVWWLSVPTCCIVEPEIVMTMLPLTFTAPVRPPVPVYSASAVNAYVPSAMTPPPGVGPGLAIAVAVTVGASSTRLLHAPAPDELDELGELDEQELSSKSSVALGRASEDRSIAARLLAAVPAPLLTSAADTGTDGADASAE